MKVTIADASATQLADFAVKNFGLDVSFRTGKERILAMLQTVGFTGAEIEVDGGQTNAGDAPAKVIVPSRGGKARRMVRITIQEQDIPGSTAGTEPVPVQHNGSLMYIPRGIEVEIPYEYFDILMNAKYRQYAPPPDIFTPLGEARDVPRFPVTVHRIDPEPQAQAA